MVITMNIANMLLVVLHMMLSFQVWATQYVKHLPIKINQENTIPSLSQESLRRLKEEENNYQEAFSWEERLRELKGQINIQEDNINKENVFIKTNDDKIMAVPRWQINEMPVFAQRLSQEEKKSIDPLDYSAVDSGISSQELGLLSDTWIQMRKGRALQFISDLPLDSLSILRGAADKIQSKLLSAVIIDQLMVKDGGLKNAFSGSVLFAQELAKPVITFLEKKEKFIFVEKELEGIFGGINKNNLTQEESLDGTKWVDARTKLVPPYNVNSVGILVGLYNKADEFRYKELFTVNQGCFTFKFDSGGRMLFGIPKSESGEFFCFDTQNQYKKCIKYRGYIGDMECFPDGKIIIFTQGKEFGKKNGNELCICRTTEDNPQPYKIVSMETPITAIAVSPNNQKFMCIAGEKLYTINNTDDAFIPSSILWTDNEKIDTFLAEKETTKAHLKPIEKAIFNSSGTKLICISKDPTQSWKSLLLLYSCVGNDYVLERIASVEMNPYRIDCAPNACVMGGLFGGVCYWKFDDLSGPILIVEDKKPYNATPKVTLSHDGRRILFSGRRDGIVQCCDYPDFIPITLDEEKQYKDVKSIEFSADDKQVSIAYGGYDSDDQYKINVITKRLYFGGPKLTLGGAHVLQNLYFAATELKRSSKITKGTLSYELFEKFPEILRNKMISAFGLKVIDDIPATSDEQKQSITPTGEIPLEIIKQKQMELAREKFRQYLEESKRVPEEKQEIELGVLQSMMKRVSQMGTYIYEKLPTAIQKMIKERKPAP